MYASFMQKSACLSPKTPSIPCSEAVFTRILKPAGNKIVADKLEALRKQMDDLQKSAREEISILESKQVHWALLLRRDERQAPGCLAATGNGEKTGSC
jgi:hypothetical protein